MRTANVLVFADIVWPDGVELSEQVMRDLCPVLALSIAGYFQSLEDEHPQLIDGKIKVAWGAPMPPEELVRQLKEEKMEASPTAYAVYLLEDTTGGTCHIFGYTNGQPLTEQQANDLATRLRTATNMVMVLPVEDQSAAPVTH